MKTVLYLGILTGILLFIGEYFAGVLGLLIALIFSMISNIFLYYYSDKMVLMFYPVYPCTDPEIEEIVKEVSKKAGIPKPRIFFMRSQYPNAFATGRNSKNAVVVITEGLVRTLDKEELKAVIGHEISHIKNYDTLISTIAAVIAGMIGFLVRLAIWGFGSRREERGPEVFLLIFVPFLALLIRLAISRQREYIADETSCKLTGNPNAMISALEKISGYKYQINPGHAHMFIYNPLPSIFELFSTHPPIRKRIERIRKVFDV